MTSVGADRALRFGVPLAGGILYTLTASRFVLGGDNGELVAIGTAGGVPHPSGYPLYVLLLRAFSWLPATSPAHRTALVTAVIAAASVAALAWAARAWGAGVVSAAIAAALYAVSPLAWSLGTHAEVFALNVLLAMILVGVSSPALGPPRGSETLRAGLLGLVAGLGLSNHHSIVLLAPLGLFALVRAIARAGPSGKERARAFALSITGLLLGLLPYVYLVAVARSTPEGDGCMWGAPGDLQRLVAHFLRRDYGTFSLSTADAAPEPLPHLAVFGKRLFVDLLGAGAVILFGASTALRAREKSKTPLRAHADLATLVASFLLAGPIFVTRFNLPARGVWLLVTGRFHLLPLALAAVLLALALHSIAQTFAADRRSLILAAGALFVVVRGGLSAPEILAEHRPTLDHWTKNALRAAPPNAVILVTSDEQGSAFMVARCALRERPDVVVVAPRLLFTAWHPRQVSARLGFPIVRGVTVPGSAEPVLSARELMEQLVTSGRPVLLTDWFTKGQEKSFPSYPVGPLLRIVKTRGEVPAPAELLETNERLFASFEIDPEPPPRASWAAPRSTDYARTWLTLAAMLEAKGDVEHAQQCRLRSVEYMPR